jgi:hypothetical protein
MSLDLKPGAVTDGLPKITLGGAAYFVPRMTLRARIAVTSMMPKLTAVIKRLPTAEQLARGELPEFADGDFDPLLDMVRQALLPLYPSLTREDLLDQPIDLIDLMDAMPVITEQGRGRRSASGEQQATS